MVSSINNVRVEQYKKPEDQQYNIENQQVQVPEADHNKKDKAQNTDVFYNHLDATQQQVIVDAIGQEGNGNVKAWGSPEKIAEALQAKGYEAKVGKDGDQTYIEVTGKDGKSYKIWDVGGDSGLGSQDIGFNGQLDDFKKDVSGLKANKLDQNQDPLNQFANGLINALGGNDAMKAYLEYMIKTLKNSLSDITGQPEQDYQAEIQNLQFQLDDMQYQYNQL